MTEPTKIKRGRPSIYANAAERQAAYRSRLETRGMRAVSLIVRIGSQPLYSAILDLSEVRRWPIKSVNS